MFGELQNLRDYFLSSAFEDFSLPKKEGGVSALDTDVFETDEKLMVIADIPGVLKKDIDISFENKILNIKVNRELSKIENSRKVWGMRRGGSQSTSISLGSSINEEDIKADLVDGVLEITLPKAKSETKKKIQINTFKQ